MNLEQYCITDKLLYSDGVYPQIHKTCEGDTKSSQKNGLKLNVLVNFSCKALKYKKK